MKTLLCKIQGHKLIAVREIGVRATPGGMLPCLDGRVAYEPHANGEHRACTRCKKVLSPHERADQK